MREHDQAQRDHNRRTYRLDFPSDLDAERVAAWVRSISGTLKSGPGRLLGVPTLAFEVWATNQGIEHRLKVPWQHADFVVSQLRSLVPGIRVTPEDKFPRRVWTSSVEVGLTHSGRQLRIYSPADVAHSLLATMQALDEGETMLMQWVVTPAVPRRQPIHAEAKTHEVGLRSLWLGNAASRDEVNDRRDKLAQPNLHAVLRVAAVADTQARSEHLVYRVKAALASTRGPASRFTRRMVRKSTLQQRIDNSAGALTFPIQLSAPELSALIAWPLGNPFIAGLPQTLSRHLPTPESVPRVGRILGRSNMPGAERQIAVDYQESLKHLHVAGPTGCLHPDTPIFDPVDNSTMTVKRRYELGEPFHVFALDGNKIVVASARPPIKYRKVGMFELYNDEHRVVVTGQHKVWNGQTFVEVRSLAGGDAPLPSISDVDLSRLLSDAGYSIQRHASSLVCCQPYCRLCGRRLLRVADNDRADAPSPIGAHAPCSDNSDRDGLVRTLRRSHAYRECDLPSKHHSWLPGYPGRDFQPLPSAGTSLLISALHPLLGICLDQIRRLGSALHTRRSALDSTDCTTAFAPAQCLPSRSSDGAPGSTLQPQSLFDVHHSQPWPTSESGQSSPASEPSSDFLFSYYFKNRTFRVRPASDETYFDFHVPGYENYLACGLIHHNSGKTALLANMVKQDMDAGYGVVIIEAKSDLFEAALNYVPKHRLDDVIVLDVADKARPVGFNVLSQGNPMVAIDELAQLFEHLYPDAKGVWSRKVLYHGLRTMITDPQLAFPDLGALLSPSTPEEADWRGALIRTQTDPEVRNFWSQLTKKSQASQDSTTQPVMDRIWQLNARPELRNIIGQSQSSFQMTDVIRDNKVLLVNLAGLPAETASLAGTLLMNSLWHAVKTTRSERPTYLYLDEFQSFLNLPTDPEDMLAKARGFGLGMVLAHQHLGQLPSDLKQAVLANTRTKVIFQTSSDDANKMASEFGSKVTPDDFTHLGRYEALARISTASGSSSPLTMNTLEPYKSTGNAKRVRELSRAKYGRPVQEVEQQIIARRSRGATPGSTPRPRPRITGLD